MTNEETKKRIENLEERKFYIYMTDHWTSEDRQMLRAIEKELNELKNKTK